MKKFLSKYAMVVAFLVMVIALSFARPGVFLTFRNAMNILRQTAVIGVITVGMAFVLLTGGIDLSVGSILAVSGVVAALLAAPGGPAMARVGFRHGEGVAEAIGSAGDGTLPLIVPVLAALLVGALIGAINGIMIAVGHVTPFIMTMGMMTIARGVALIISGGGQLPYLTDSFKAIGKGNTSFGIPYLAFIFIGVLLIAAIVLKYTRYGRSLYAVGGNEMAARTSGINATAVRMSAYIVSGVCAGLAGLLLASRTAVGSPQAGSGYELDAIAGCVVGGISLDGGVGNIWGALLGTLFISVMGNGMDMLGITTYYQDITKGIIIILAVFYDMNSKRMKD